MLAPGYLGVIVLLHCFIEGHMSTSCATFGNNLDPTNAPLQATNFNNRRYASIGTSLMCMGNATQWNWCYYPPGPSRTATLAVYRKCSQHFSSTGCTAGKYALVPGGSTTLYSNASLNGNRYACSSTAVTPQFTVWPGDILVACVPMQGLRIAANISGSSVNYLSGSSDCTSVVDLSSNTNSSGLTILVSLDVNECAVNNGGCGHICIDTTPGYNCTCYPGYELLADGLNCANVNECLVKNGGCDQVCNDTTPGYFCSCDTGYQLLSGGMNCTNVNECILNNGGCGQICNDTIPGYICSCYLTYQLLPDGMNCAVTTRPNTSIPGSNTVEGSTPAFASVIVIILVAIVIAAVVIIVLLWKRKYVGILRPASATQDIAMDNVMYTATTTSATLLSNKVDLSAIYEPVKDDEFRNAHDAQAIYEDPEMSDVKCLNEKMNQPDTSSDDPRSEANDYTLVDQQKFEESHEVEPEDENLYYMPASCEQDLYVQLENHRIRKISRNTVSADKMLGSGQFGGVQMGIWNGSKERCEVAIKTLSPTTTQPDAKVKFLQEAAIMAQFRHPNIIQLHGIILDGEPIMLVLELANKKDLRTHLGTMKPDPGQMIHPDIPSSLLSYSRQTAAGMKYLSNKSFVHRDLAARNILVTKDCTCKIADFGLSRDLADDTYYVSHGGMVPIKWTAPEAIHFKKYSTASDVWSYGCLLYEIWSMGVKPFEGKTNAEVVQKVDMGYRLPPPPGCPRLIYQMMIQCWNPGTHSRPLFGDIYQSLCQPEELVLVIPCDVNLIHPNAGIVGASLEAGEDLYIELQKSYLPM